MTRHLLDATVLIALSIREHEHHDRASVWLAGAGDFALCPVTEGALVRFLIRLGESGDTATALLHGIRAHALCEFWADDLSYADLDLTRLHGHRQVTDTYLVGLAQARSERLATLDEGLHAAHPHAVTLLP